MKTFFKNQFNFSSVFYCAMFYVLFVSLTSCKKDDDTPKKVVDKSVKVSEFSPQATFVVNNAEESMPVWVNGNSNSKSIILVMHGGPGSDVLDFRTYKDGLAFKKIEESYQIAYWQQRAAGQSKGPDNLKYYTINQYVDDADKVVEQLRKNYPGKKIVLFGHSWGGMLSSTYLKDATRRSKISGWIDVAGAHNGKTLAENSFNDVIREINARIVLGTDIDEWKQIKKYAEENKGEINKIAYSIVDEIPEVLIKVDNDDFKKGSRFSSSNTNLFKEIIVTDNNPFLKDITMPCLLLWGKYDFAVSRVYQGEFLANIGSKAVTSVDFNSSGHYMMFQEPVLFTKAVVDFMGKLQ